MVLYQNEKKLLEVGFGTDNGMQQYCERNLQTLLGITYLSQNVQVGSVKIQTLAYDGKRNAFSLLIYRNDTDYKPLTNAKYFHSVIMQHQAELVLKFNKHFMQYRDTVDFDWSQTRYIFVSRGFIPEQKDDIHTPIPSVELWSLRMFQNNIVQMICYFASSSITISKQTVSEPKSHAVNPAIYTAKSEAKGYTEEAVLASASVQTRHLYFTLKDYICSLGSEIKVVPMKVWVAFKYNDENLFSVAALQSGLKVTINHAYGKMNDPYHVLKNVTDVGHWGQGDYQFNVYETSNLEKYKQLLNQAYHLKANEINNKK